MELGAGLTEREDTTVELAFLEGGLGLVLPASAPIPTDFNRNLVFAVYRY